LLFFSFYFLLSSFNVLHNANLCTEEASRLLDDIVSQYLATTE